MFVFIGSNLQMIIILHLVLISYTSDILFHLTQAITVKPLIAYNFKTFIIVLFRHMGCITLSHYPSRGGSPDHSILCSVHFVPKKPEFILSLPV